MRIIEYRTMKKEKLEDELKNLQRELVKSYGAMGMAKVKKNKGGISKCGSTLSRKIKKEIARCKTILKEREEE